MHIGTDRRSAEAVWGFGFCAPEFYTRRRGGNAEAAVCTCLRVEIVAPAHGSSPSTTSKNLNGPGESSLHHAPRLRGPRREWPVTAPRSAPPRQNSRRNDLDFKDAESAPPAVSPCLRV